MHRQNPPAYEAKVATETGMGRSAEITAETDEQVLAEKAGSARWLPRKKAKGEGERRKDILQAACDVLVQEGYHAWSMRRVASKCGIHLKTLQHYFETKRDLILETVDYTLESHYLNQYAAFSDSADGNSSRETLSKVLVYLIADCREERTSKFFSELWALSFRDEGARAVLDSFYVHHREQLEEMILRANPKLDRKTAKLRAAVIACQIEGLVPVVGYDKPDHEAFTNMDREVHDRILAYAYAD